MKVLVQKLTRSEGTSFVARTYRTPHYEVGWHCHSAYELILLSRASGSAFIGNYAGHFECGDVYLLGPNLPHTFRKQPDSSIAEAIVVQFEPSIWGKTFTQAPESRGIKTLLNTAARGLKIHGESRETLATLIRALEQANGFRRMLVLGECLEVIRAGCEFESLCSRYPIRFDERKNRSIERVLRFTSNHFRQPIALREVAAVAGLSVPAFCTFFKRSTKKTYSGYLNETRVAEACSLLLETEKPISWICYESGYATPANFHKQFKKIKGMSPLNYRRMAA